MHYTVCTPQYWDYGDPWLLEPPEYGADCVEVESDNKRRAKVLAVQEMRKRRMLWVRDQQSDKASPFTGLEVFELECLHGICHCMIKDCLKKGDCKICYEEAVGEPYPED